MSIVPGLVSPYVKTGRLLYVARVLAKIRLHAAGKLPVDEYAANLGGGFDERCCTFLRIDYQELKRRVLEGSGLEDKPILTMFDYIDFDEGRDPVSTRAWEAKG
jgi:gluconokinase